MYLVSYHLSHPIPLKSHPTVGWDEVASCGMGFGGSLANYHPVPYHVVPWRSVNQIETKNHNGVSETEADYREERTQAR